ncbi:DUF2855 family protein [Candidatus Phycosocius spiralis]|uniref:DUF2855 domain-containing protein n=1 Tax=Candidatus Phycosocius spiralis TaxID=2815099 RepID=A0ABQ4PTG5_9PROT|nr:DUF2855 family protein [Candidatus Phycosocius spiralis]GIU66311.1 hypothetical protein PsB1_0465 [Candidatus Phycosocius spiralis]
MNNGHSVLEMAKQSFYDMKLTPLSEEAIGEGEALIAISRFALTANNVTYAKFGDAMAYWNFFPASAEHLGRVPVWGFGDVVASKVEAVVVGTRVYGFFPIATALKVQPIKINALGFRDGAPHRQAMAQAYNHYAVVTPKDGETEGRIALFKPLFTTGFLLDNWIFEEHVWGAKTIISSSASSKTALAMNACLKRSGGVKLVGLTAPQSIGFVEATGYYDEVVSYQAIDTLPVEASVFVDFAGDPKITRDLHTHLEDQLKASIIVGGAHWDATQGASSPLPGPKPQFFFAPTHLARLSLSLGGAELNREIETALVLFIQDSQAWLDIEETFGFAGAEQAWKRLLDHEVAAKTGIMIQL